MTSYRWALPVLGAMVGSSLSAIGAAAPAYAAPDPTAALGLPADVTATVTGSGVVATREFNDFPSAGADYYVLSTGLAGAAFPAVADDNAQLSTDFGNDGVSDSSALTLTVQEAPGRGCLFVDFALGTEEPVHKYTENVPGDRLTIMKDGADYATNAGRGYFQQERWRAEPKPYMVNALDYWHRPGDRLDPIPGTPEEPWLPPATTALNNLTTRDTARIPLDFTDGAEVVEIAVSDANNGDLDSVAMLDDVRFGASCSAGTGVEPNPAHDGGVIVGPRGVGNALAYDPVPSTVAIEGYDDDAQNGWRSPSGVPVELRFRWYRTSPGFALDGDMTLWDAIPDADRQTYVPTAGDKGQVLICLVTGVVDGRRYETFPSTGQSGTWYVTTPIANGTFLSGTTPTIAGTSGDDTPTVNDILTATAGRAVPREDTWSWRWYANGRAISGATGPSIRLSPAEAGKTITVEATAKRLNFESRAFMSEPYGPVELQGWTATDVPTISADGGVEFGKTLTVNPGDGWAPVPDTYSYQWRRNGSVIPGAIYPNYTIKADDVGTQLTVAVSGLKDGFETAPQESAPVTVLGATMTGATPVVTGTPQVGQRLTGSVTGWSPSGATLTYEWYAGDTLLQQGGTSLTVPAAAMGRPVVLKVTGHRSGYTPRTVASLPTSSVVPGELTSDAPDIRGYAKVGQTLTASPGYWGPRGVKLTYRWKIGKRRVTGAKGARPSLVIPRTARGKRITVTVTGRLAGYETVGLKSSPTAKVIR